MSSRGEIRRSMSTFMASRSKRDWADYALTLECALYAALNGVEVGFDPNDTEGEIEMREMDDGHILVRRKPK